MKAKKNRGILSEPAAVGEGNVELVDSNPPTRFRRALDPTEHAEAHGLRRRRNRFEVDMEIEIRVHRDHVCWYFENTRAPRRRQRFP